MRLPRPACSPGIKVWPVLAGLAILVLLKYAAAIWGGSALLLAQAGYSTGELAALLSALPVAGRKGCFAAGAGRPHSGRLLRSKTSIACIACSVLLPALGAILLWKGMLLLTEKNQAAPSPLVFAMMLIFLLAELVIWFRLSAVSRRRRSLDAAAAAGSIRADLCLLGGAIPLHMATTYNWQIPEALAVTGFGILVLLQSLGLARFGLSALLDSCVMDKVLRPVRERAAATGGVAAVAEVKGFRPAAGGGLNLRVSIIAGGDKGPSGIEQLNEAVKHRLEKSFGEVTRVSVQAVSLCSVRERAFGPCFNR